jgi:hypothetical protein
LNRIARTTRLALLLALVTVGCGTRRPAAVPEWASVRELTPTFLAQLPARDPALATDGFGRVALTYVTRDSNGADLWLALSSDSGSTFGEPRRVNERRGSVGSYPEGRPLPVFGPSGQLVVVWAEKRELGGGVDVVVRASGDGGRTLEPTVAVNDDVDNGKPTYHGFPALTFLPNGALAAAWLDERNVRVGNGEPSYSALFGAVSGDGGLTWSANAKLADEVCPCCRPSLVADSAGTLALAFRTADEDLRDPMLALSKDGGITYSSPAVVSDDRWSLKACPDVGPTLSVSPRGGGEYAWYTGAAPAGVYLVPWRDETGAAGVRRRIDADLYDASHPRLTRLGDVTLLTVEARPQEDTTRTVLAARLLERDGTLTAWTPLGADVVTSWIAPAGTEAALACWSERAEDGTRVRVARLVRKH